MNYKRILTFFAVTLFMVVTLTVEGECRARASRNWIGWKRVSARAQCSGTGGAMVDSDQDSGFGTRSSFAYVNCTSSGAWAWAWASGRRLRVTARAWARVGSSSADKDLPPIDTDSDFVAIDTTSLEMDTVLGGIQLALAGKMNAVPGITNKLTIELFQNDDTSDVFFEGTVELFGGSGDFAVTGFNPSHFSFYTQGDTITLDFSDTVFSAVIPYSGELDSLGNTLTAEPIVVGSIIPTLTEWGMIIFCVLLFGWMAWVIVRRRRRGTIGI